MAHIAIATSSSSSVSLFESPNESAPIRPTCLLEKATAVNYSPSKTISTNPTYLIDCVENICEEDDESRELGSWLASLEGETKEKVNALLRQLDDANSLIDEKEEIIVTLENHGGGHSSNNKELEEAFEEGRSIRASLEEKLSSLEETYAICVSKLRKDNELSLELVGLIIYLLMSLKN